MTERHLHIKERASSFACNEAPPLTSSNKNNSNNGRSSNSRSSSSKATKTRHRRSTSEDDPLGMACRELAQDLRRRSSLAPSSPSSAAPSCASPERHKEKSPSKKSSTSRSASSSSSSATRSSRARKLAKAGTVARFSHSPKTSTSSRSSSEDVSSSSSSTKTTTTSSTLSLSTSAVALTGSSSRSSIMARKGRSTSAGGISSQLCLSSDGNTAVTAPSTSSHDNNSNVGPNEDRLPNVSGESENGLNKVAVSAGNENNLHSPKPSRKTHNEAASSLTSPNRSSSGRSSPVMDEPSASSSSSGKALEPVMKQLVAKMASRVHSLPHSLSKLPLALESQQQQQQGPDDDSSASKKRTSANPNPLSASSSSASYSSGSKKSPLLGRHSSLTASSGSLPSVPSPSRGKHEYSKKEESSASSTSSSSSSKRATKRTGSSGSISNFYRSLSNSELPTTSISSASSASDVSVLSASSSTLNYDASLSGSGKSPARRGILTRGIRHARDKRAKALEMKKDKRKSTRMKKTKGKKGVASSSSSSSSLSNVEEAGRGGSSGGRTSSEREREGEREEGEEQGVERPRKSSSSLLPSFGSASSSSMVVTRTNSLPFSAKDEMVVLPRRKTTEEATEVRDEEEEEDEEEAEDEEEEAEDEEEDEEDPDADEEGENPLSPEDSEEASLEERIEEGMTRFNIAMAKLDNERVDVKGKLECMNELVELCKSLGAEVIPGHPTGFHSYSFVKSMRVFVAHPVSKTMRQAALRVLRYFLASNSMALYQQLIAQNLAYIIARILERDKEVTGERVEALKLIRRMMEVDIHCRLLPHCLLKAIIALIHQNNRPNHNNANRTKAMDSFSCSCLETLCQLVVRNPKLVAECNGMKTLFWAAVEPFYAPLQDSVLVSLLYVMDEPARRMYIRPESDLRALFAPLMDVFTLSSTGGGAVGSEQMERWTCCLRAISGILKSWAGLVFLYSDPLCLKSLMDGLRLPCEELHDIILDNMFKIFRLPTPKSNAPLTSMMMVKGKVMSKWGAEMGLVSDLPSRTYGKRANILDGYLAALLIVFVDIGLIECLIDLGKRQVSGTSNQSHVNSNYIPNIGVTSSPSNHPSSPINHKHNLLDVASASASASSTSFLANTPKATVLLGELLHLANTLLPSSQCARLQQLPTLLHHAVTFQLHPRFWASANTTVNQLHHITNTKTIHSTHFYDREQCVAITGANRLKRLKGWDRRLDRIDHVKRKMDWEMDGKTLLSKLNTTQVLFTKDHEKWEWDVIAEVLEGPLRNPAHLDYCLANTKTKSFLERIIHFFKPSAHLFSSLPWKPSNENTRLVRVACQMLENLVHSENGNAFLNGGDLLKELSDLLKALAEGNTEVVASIGSVQETMAREYFTMIGTLSSSTEGLEIMKKYKMFSYLRQIAQMEGGNLGLQRLALTCLDYNTSHGPARPLLKTCLSSPSKAIRCIATMHLRVLLRAGVQMFSAWGIDYLVKQLADSDPQVASIALSVLDEACDVRECLESLIAKRPSLFHMGRAGKDLLLRFLSVRSGFTYLSEIDFVKGELLSWKESESLIYVQELEHRLEQTLSVLLDDDKEVIDKVTIPPHLYGELAKTEAGCEVLANSGHLEECLLALTSPACSPSTASAPSPSSSSASSSDFTGIQRRAAAWALGHVGASVTGLRLLEPHQAVKTLANLAQRDSSLSFRGTCFYALGLISRTEQGRSLLAELGWESPPDLNVSLPKDMQSNNGLFMLAKYQFAAGWADLSQEATASTTEASPSSSSLSGASLALTPMTVYQVDDMRSQIITSVSNLCSKVTKKTHKMNLIRLRQRHPEAFQSRELVFDLFRMLECYCLTASTRRFIYNFQNPYLLDHQFFDLVSQRLRPRHNGNRGGAKSAVPTLLLPPTASSSPSAPSRYSSKEKGKEKEGERVSIRREDEEEDTTPQSALKKYLEVSSI